MIPHKTIVVIGGAGFVGSNLAIILKTEHPNSTVIAFDNLYRRGSELALNRLKTAQVRFIHGDIRCPEDLASLDPFDLMIDCSAEPSVQAGYNNGPTYFINTNLLGTIHCLTVAKKFQADFIFLSTSRVYSIKHLQRLPLIKKNKRFHLKNSTHQEGLTHQDLFMEQPNLHQN
jgi:CDP-paratose 2-epimerase